jgi:hypothetical protein
MIVQSESQKIKSEFSALRVITASKKQTTTKDYLQKNVRIKPTANALGLLSSIALSSLPQVNYCH